MFRQTHSLRVRPKRSRRTKRFPHRKSKEINYDREKALGEKGRKTGKQKSKSKKESSNYLQIG